VQGLMGHASLLTTGALRSPARARPPGRRRAAALPLPLRTRAGRVTSSSRRSVRRHPRSLRIR
jgi:hypothetical protein